MASIGQETNGRRRILFVAANGQRKTVRLGKVSQRDAEQVCRHIEALVASTIHGQAMPRETAVWLKGVGDKLHDRLARVGLAEPRAEAGSDKLIGFVDRYIESRTDAKPRTIISLRQTRRELLAHFGKDRTLASITAGDADAFRLALLARKLADNTVRRFCGRARQFFRAAMRLEMIERDPFAGIKCAVGANPSRLYFVTREEAGKVLDACPNAEWRLIFALSRYGGLRCPSEHMALRWGDINWEHNRMLVRSVKTEHHEGKDVRMIPIFPELLPYLREVFEQAEPGAEHVITHYRRGCGNLGVPMRRAILRAGLKPWPKLFHNLRATRETELAESFPLHVVCAWIGNSSTIAARHYLQVTDEHFAQATSVPDSKAARIPAQQEGASGRVAAHGENENPGIPAEKRLHAPARAGMQSGEMVLNSPGGARTSGQNIEQSEGDGGSGTNSGTPADDDDLAAVIDAWPVLPKVIRQKIISLCRRDGEEGRS